MSRCSTRHLALIVFAAAVLLTTPACNEVQDPFTFNPTPTTYTENFSGSLNRGGVSSHPFVVSVSGTVTLTLTQVQPDAELKLGFDIGTWDGTTCNPIFGTGSREAVQGYAFAGSAVVGNFCARIHDGANKIPEDVTVSYNIRVDHP